MKKIIVVLFVLLTSCALKAQEIYFNTGKNICTYDFKDQGNEIVNLNSDIGNSFEVGYINKSQYDQPIYYSLGLGLNEYNATGYFNASNLKWKTSFLNLKAKIYYALISDVFNELTINMGIVGAKIVRGNQEIDGKNYDLRKQEEFSGVFIGPLIGLKYSYAINQDIKLNLFYDYSNQFNFGNKSSQRLNFNNHYFGAGLSVNIY